ncbi:sigma-70 family RNA polymerase sigma factor [Streptomyces sp. NPDC002667]|uniref:sigma-70 family RNA polymerase sigma factor n=1 Tax=Streptomyces sp. NPDC002667 TaxID=3364657 RepID=UPI0036C82DCD
MSEGTATTTDLDVRLERHRVELTGYCYRMLGSSFEAEDAVQDTMVRAWRSYDKFEGRSSMRSWLYRIATNVCLDMLNAGNRRARPMDLSAPSPLAQAALTPRPDNTWLEPVPDARVLPSTGDPAEAAVAKESVRLAFMAALQRLPPKQRAVLILREVLAWRASEVAELLGTTVASVNSALQRARATLAEKAGEGADAAVSDPLDEEQQKLLERYVAAFEGYDMTALTALLHEDAVMTMPPFDLWLRGPEDITGFMTTLGAACAGSRLVPVEVNGLPGFAQYKPDEDGRGHTAWAVQALEISKGRIAGFHCFLDTARWFPLFGLPLRLDGSGEAGAGGDGAVGAPGAGAGLEAQADEIE